MQSTLAFAPTQDDLDEFYFDVPIIVQGPVAELPEDLGDGAEDLPKSKSA